MAHSQEKEAGPIGLVITDAAGKCLQTLGIGADRRLRAVVSDRAWLDEASTRRLGCITLVDVTYCYLVTEIAEGFVILFSEPPSETVLQFILNVDFAYDIIDHILTDPYDAMAIVDEKARLRFMSPVHEKFLGLQPGEGIGKKARDVIENSRLHNVLRTGVAEVGQVHRMKGRDRIVSRHPIRHDNKIVGAIGRIMFKGPQQVEAMSRRINQLEQEIETYKANARPDNSDDKILEAIVGQSIAIQSVREQIRKIAPLDIPVLIQGESGTGKELVAQALHRLSPRQDGRLVTVNAAALPESLVESELFGYEPGSFTGADRKGRAGKFEMADKGTIFLDEIGDMPLEVQSKLLRVLQDRMVERVGGEKPKRVDFRLCSATNRDLEDFVDQGRFRLDLFYRISPVCIQMPTLQERLEDIPLLLNQFVADLSAQHNRPVPEIGMDVSPYLMEQEWPGNVRQLRHNIERALVFASPERLTVEDFRDNQTHLPQKSDRKTESDTESASGGRLRNSLDELEMKLISDTIIRFKGNKKRAAEHLGVSRSYLYKKLEHLN